MVTSSPANVRSAVAAPRLVVDLNRCQSYGQCVFAAPTVFRFHGTESLEYDYAPDPGRWAEVRRAAAACPVQAISLGVVPGSDSAVAEVPGE